MRRIMILVVALAILATTAIGVGFAQEQQQLPDHPHMLVLHLEFGEVDGTPAVLGWHRCIDLAGGRNVPLHAHHAHLHFGSVGEVLFDNAGHAVIGAYPLAPWADCAEFETLLPILFDDEE